MDASLYEEALSFIDPHLDSSALVQEALQTFIRVKVGQRLSALHGVAPHMPSIPRRS
nr:type II toxin-antitoxin system VapB family antitoxin [Roseateles depolymerans]